jgi:hypothetical protein
MKLVLAATALVAFLSDGVTVTVSSFTINSTTKTRVSFVSLSSSTSSDQQQQQQQSQITSDKSDAKAGEEGYSILRQPLNWDVESDPRFDAPKSLDESKEENYKTQDAAWFQNRFLGDVGANVNVNINMSSNSNNNNDNRNDNRNNDLQQQQQNQQHRTEEFNQEINLFQRTLDTLDYPIILNALRQQCNTAPAQLIVSHKIDENKNDTEKNQNKNKRKVNGTSSTDTDNEDNDNDNSNSDGDVLSMKLTAPDVEGIHQRYDAIKEMNAIMNNLIPTSNNKRIERIPLSNCDFNIQPMLDKIDNGNVLDGPDILEVSMILEACLKVGDWCIKLDDIERKRKRIQKSSQNNANDNTNGNDWDEYGNEVVELKQLPEFGYSIFIEDELIDLLENAFDDEGRLSGSTFPTIGRLRSKVRTLKNDILGTLESIMASPSIANKVSLESGGAVYSEVNGRIVIPIADKYKNSVGIIHDQSRSGKTAYVEPNEVVGPTNEMRSAEMELKQEEMKVWRQLTNKIKDNREDIDRSIAAVAQLDLVSARIRLGDLIDGVVPDVGDEGVISLKEAKHPVLLLRKLDNVVGSDIDIGAGKNQGLVLTGPNSGGKTVILKLMGLCALMARDGIPVPAQSKGARVDFFNPVLADIGDLQSVDGDLSTFSGHMLVCREVLANSGKNALVLMGKFKV